ncbi:MAG: amino acid adenylation domain-containing protein [Planctomycetota bacterium]
MTDDELEKRLAGLSPAKRKLLERRLREKRRAEGERNSLRRLDADEAPFVLSFAQERFWFLEQLEPGNPAHHLPGHARLTGPMDLDAYRRTWETILARHESLRTVFALDGERPTQRVREHIELPLEVIDLRGLPLPERENERIHAIERAVRTPFDLAHGPLIRLQVLRLGEEEHELVSCMHHIIADGISVQLMGAEIEACYRAFVAGEQPRVPPLPVQMRDFAAWQRARLTGSRERRGLDYWTRRLADLPTLELPTDLPRVDAWNALGRREGLDLSEALVADLRRLAREDGATLYMVLLAGFSVALRHWTGSTDIPIGTLVAGRDRAELEALVGLFINTVVQRTDLTGEPSFREAIARVKQGTLEAQDYQDCPFERVVDALQPERRLDRNPLFSVLFNFVDFRGYVRDLGGGLSMAYELSQAGTLFDLTLYATVGGDDLRLEFEYDETRFTPATVRRLLGHLETLLFAAVAAPERPVDDLPLLGYEERRALARWSRGPTPRHAGDETLDGLVAAQADRTPDRPAIEQGEARLTYAELEARAREVAGSLAADGVGPGDLVGVALPRSIELLPTLLGILKRGAAYVPLDPTFPAERLAFMEADAGLRVVLSTPPPTGAPPAEGPSASSPASLAYVLYTSGSTGRPKGVRIPHRAVVNFLTSMARTPGLSARDTLLAVTTLSFDISVLELFGPLTVGGRVRIATAEEAGDGTRLAELLDDEAVTVLQATPATWRMLRLAGWRGRTGLRALCGGEALPRDLADELRGCCDELWNLYGPTETTVWSTLDRVVAGPITIGRPLQGTHVRVVSERGVDVPAGIPGELWIGGAGLADGYHGRPELTAERFVTQAGERFYRTGDRVRWRPDGRLEYLGREDAQVKLRGFRIELGEIEAALRSHPAVHDAAAAIREPRPGDRRLVAWILQSQSETTPLPLRSTPPPAPPRTPQGGWGLGMEGGGGLSGELRSHLQTQLPPWMLPSAFVEVDAIPLTPGGKVDRPALPDPAPAPRPGGAGAPTTPTEQALAPLWAEVLGVSDAGPLDDFFQLGGHSLLATQLASRVRTRLGVEMGLRDFFAAPTLGALAAQIDRLAERARSAPPAIEVSPRRTGLPLSFAQERLWFLESLGDTGAAYHMPGALQLRGELDADALERALAALVRRHESLRTGFHATDGGPVQSAEHELEFALERRDWTRPGEDLGPQLAADAARPFDLSRPPLVRATLYRIAPREHVLLVVLHHIVSDAWSIGVIVRELKALYGALLAGERARLPELPLQYADFAGWQRGWLTGRRLERELGYWREALAGAPAALELPTDRSRPAVQSHRGERLLVALGSARAARLRSLAAGEDATLFMVLLAAFQTLLFRLSGQDDIVVGTTVAGRRREDVEGLVGFFAGTLPLRARLGGQPSFRELIARVRERVLEALEHQEVPFEKLVDELQPVRDLARQPIFQVSFDLLNVPAEPPALPGLELATLPMYAGASKFDLSLQTSDDAELTSTLELNADLFDVATVRRWWGHFEHLIDAALERPDLPIGRLRLVSPEERAALIARGVGEAGPLPSQPLHATVARVAAERPDAVAVRDGEGSWSYAELARHAAAVAASLVAHGVERGSLVGVCLPRQRDLIATLLGVWRAGAAWLPLDPAHPRARLASLVSDAGAEVVVADGDTCALVEGAPARIVRADEPTARPTVAGAVEVGLDDLAYVLYTSGSTGRPKGVEIAHRSVAHYVEWAARRYGVDAGDGTPVHSSIGFDLTLTSLLPALVAGRTVTLVAEGEGVEPLAESARAWRGMSLVKLTPSHLDVLARELSSEEARGWTAAFVVGGEALHADTLRPWREHAPDTRIFNEYGPTEATVGCVLREVTDEDLASGVVPIGRPLPNTRAYVVDAGGEPVPVGVAGELWIGGAGVALGYRGAPDRTSERFGPDPFAEAGARVYRTGDLVRWRADGQLLYLGRVDEQITVRGVRVEPAEVEEAMRRARGVDDAAVALRDGRLIGYVAGEPGELSALRSALAAELPEALVPAAFVRVDALPLSANGKLDRGALPEPERDDLTEAGAFEAPTEGAERALAALWADALGLERVGRLDNFFALGGDSILSIQIVARAAEAGLHLRTRDLFEHQTVAALAAVAGVAPSAGVERAPLEGEVPLLPAQRWLLERELPQLSHWNQALAFEARRGVTAEDVERALAVLVEHHDALRMRFERRAGGWAQVCGAARPPKLRRIDLAHVDAGGLEPAFARESAALQATLDPEAGEVLRAAWFELGDAGPARLLLVLHHLVVDGVSWRVLLDDLARLLRAGDAGQLPPRTSSVADFALALAGDTSKQAAPPRRVDGNDEGSVLRAEIQLDEGSTAALLGPASRAYRASVDDLVLAALGLVLGRHEGADELRIDLEGHGRVDVGREVDVTRTIGWFTRILPLAVPGAASLEPGERICAVKEARRALGERAGAAPGSTVLFNFLGRVDARAPDDAPLAPLAVDVGPDKGASNPRAHALELDARVQGERLRVLWRASTALHDAATVQRLAEELRAELRALIEHCLAPDAGGCTPSDFPLAALDARTLRRVAGSGRGVADVLPLTATQQGMFFHSLYEPGTAAYFEELTNVLEGSLDAAALRGAFEAIVERHELFRARVAWKGLSEPLLVIERRIELPRTELDWRDVPRAEQGGRLDALAAEDRARGFDLERGPLFRVTLLRLGPRRFALSFRYHHLILDGWSMPLVLEDVLAAYGALRAGDEPAARPVAPWRDYVAWLRRRDPEAARAFWRDRLAGFERATPVGRVDRPARGAYGERELFLDRELSQRLRAFAQGAGVTMSTVVQGAWSILLARWSGEREVVFGATVSGRPPELRDVGARVGLFINTLPVRVRLDEAVPVDDWLRGLQRERAEELAWEWTPLPLSQSCADTAPGAPLFESIVVFENYPLDEALKRPPGDLLLIETRVFERTSYAATLVAVPGERLLLRVLFDEGRFDDDEAERMVEHLRSILVGIAAAPTQALGDVPVLAARERQRLLYEWSADDGAIDAPALVHDAFRERAQSSPDAIAVLAGDRSWTYRELDARSDAVAAALAQRGAGAETVVGLLTERSPELLAGLLGILKAGAAYLPLEPAHPDARHAEQLGLCEAQLLVTTRALRSRAQRLTPAFVEVDALADAAAPTVELAPSQLAYVITTSGSTGAPKGVAIEHRSIAHYARVARELYGVQAGERVLQFASIAFDTSAEEIFPALAAGATLVLRDDAMLGSPAAFARAVSGLALDVLNFPTAYWHELTAGLTPGDAQALAGVRLVILGGEEIRPQRLARWRELVGAGPRVLNTYGPTEATVVCAVEDVTGAADEPVPQRVPIGRPIAGARVYVLDREQRPVPQGVAGELCVGGPGVARGYAGRPELTRERFVPELFPLAGPGERLYRTGDRVRFEADGRLSFLGRVDGQVKVRGHRVELGEVEQALLAHTAVAEAAVLRREREDGGDYLAAYVVASDTPPSTDELDAFLRERLPEPMVPARFAVLDALPRTATGKLDRAALAQSEGAVARGEARYVAPRTRDERAVAALFERVLEVDRVGAADDFFALGGDSLVAIRLMAGIAELYGVELPLRDLFDGPTPAEVAATVAALASDGLDELRTRRAVDLRAEAALPDDVRPAAGSPTTPPRRVFVTGGTGFLGSHVLAELAAQTGAEIEALVRAEDEEAGRARLHDVLARHGLWSDELARRLHAIPGDLAAPRFGLAEEAFDALAGRVDAVFHVGASTNFFQPYASLKAANVGGTLEAVRLAARGVPKALHHVSTVGVFDVPEPPPVLGEDLELDDFRAVRGGYAQSKWVAEALVAAAAERGLAATVFRPGRLVAGAQGGVANEGDVALELLRVCLELGVSPDLSLAVDATPVDYAARALVHLALAAGGAAGGAYHLVNEVELRPAEIAASLCEIGLPLRPVPGVEWWQALRARVEADPRHRFFPLLPLFADAPELAGAEGTPAPRLDDARARAVLTAAGIRPPAFDRAYFERLRRCGALP